jgi:hypothetical protein
VRVGGRVAGHVAAHFTDGGSGLDRPGLQPWLAVLNAAHRDRLTGGLAPLALPMTLRHNGADLDVDDPQALRQAYPHATGRPAVFLHGLGETERPWRYRAEHHHGHPTVTYGTLLQRDLGYTRCGSATTPGCGSRPTAVASPACSPGSSPPGPSRSTTSSSSAIPWAAW